jgi:hypothetical protein
MLLLYLFIVVILLFSLAGCGPGAIQSTDVEEEAILAVLHIHLQEGFTGDTVVVQVNGREVFHKDGVQTKLLLGYADTLEVQVPEASVNVEISVPSKNISETIIIERVSETPYLGVSIQAGKITYIKSNKPFGYG